jgi:RIO kinase 1
MRVPESLFSLTEIGVIDEVVRPLMSGKEAQLYVVVAGGEERVAKVYKEATQRSFQRRSDYTDGRQIRNSRDRRAMNKRSRHGKARDEAAWRAAEVDIIYRLRDAGVRVPEPYNYMDGVLVMELVKGADGLPAPRLGDISFTPQAAQGVYDELIRQVVRMLCAGVVHGDLSEFNVLMGPKGPVIIDFPQAVDPASNSSARRLLVRDVDNLHRFLSHSVNHPRRPYAQEMWNLFERNELDPETPLRGQFRDRRKKANTKDVLGLIGEARRDEARRGGGRRGRQNPGAKGGRSQQKGPVVEMVVRSTSGRTQRVRSAGGANEQTAKAAPKTREAGEAPAKKRRRRRRRSGRKPAGRSGGDPGSGGSPSSSS